MGKIVYNACFGGFGLSAKAMHHYAGLKGMTLYPERDPKFPSLVTFWRVPESERVGILTSEEFLKADTGARIASNQRYADLTLRASDIERHDPALVATVEALGKDAYDKCAKLKIADLPTGTLYRISEYDGMETVETWDDLDWKAAP